MFLGTWNLELGRFPNLSTPTHAAGMVMVSASKIACCTVQFRHTYALAQAVMAAAGNPDVHGGEDAIVVTVVTVAAVAAVAVVTAVAVAVAVVVVVAVVAAVAVAVAVAAAAAAAAAVA
eukprot:73819-Amphidinium_carterae.1